MRGLDTVFVKLFVKAGASKVFQSFISPANTVAIIDRYELYQVKDSKEFKEFSNSGGILLRVYSEEFCYDRTTAEG